MKTYNNRNVGRHRNEEVTGNDCLGMGAYERGPTSVRGCGWSRTPRQVLPHRSRRDADAELEAEFIMAIRYSLQGEHVRKLENWDVLIVCEKQRVATALDFFAATP